MYVCMYASMSTSLYVNRCTFTFPEVYRNNANIDHEKGLSYLILSRAFTHTIKDYKRSCQIAFL